MLLFILILILIAAVLLILVVLAQNPKGGGLSSQFGGSGASNIIGVKKTSDLLEKLTWGFAVAIVVLSMSTKLMISNQSPDEASSPNLERAGEQQQALPPSLDLNDQNSGNTDTDNSQGDDQTTNDSQEQN
ncbi:MAG: preprotein translocase subunit SecG [Cyclobacteriaceae bacterium]|nr:preprotein translocase subunit SecG [Cyclobacteriaceae bacterium]